MTAACYDARTEAGVHLEDPSEQQLLGLLNDLDEERNSFVIITTARDTNRHAVVSLREDRDYQVERHDAAQGWHEVRTDESAGTIARDLITWFASPVGE